MIIYPLTVIETSLSEPHTSKSFVGSSFYKYKQQKMNTKPYKFLCNTKVLYIQDLPYMVIGSSVSWKACDRVFLDGHIWSLDCQSRKACDKVFLNSHVWSLDHQCCGKYTTKSSWMVIAIWSLDYRYHGSIWQSFTEWPWLFDDKWW